VLPDLLPSCEVVIAHGGAGTVLSALTAGVPLVLLPSGSPSQLRMTEACLRRGVADRPDDGGASIAALRAAIEEVVVDQRFRHAARDVAAEIAAMPPPEQVVPLLEELAAAGPQR
jgi:UDP:flavonoid glycosyltransferase YjiC (YdhE family)